MRELVVISGKGGTGKTSMVAALAAIARPLVLVDADVDAPDLELVTSPVVQSSDGFSGGRKASIVREACCGCGGCRRACRAGAVAEAPGNGIVAMTYAIDPIACEGCGACVAACPADAIRFEPVTSGQWFTSRTRFGPMVHARLNAGEGNSGKMVSLLRHEARQVAAKARLPLILVDGSPGVGCAVIASLTGADLALVVGEPTPSGIHDALRVLELTRLLGIPAAVCTNRWDLDAGRTDELERKAISLGAVPVGRVREDMAVVDAQMQAVAVVELPSSPAAGDVRRLWLYLQNLLFSGNTHASAPRQRILS